MNVRRMGLGGLADHGARLAERRQVRGVGGPGPAPAPTPTLPRAATVDLTVISAADVGLTGGPVVIGVPCFLLLSRKRRTCLWNALHYRRKELGNVRTFSR